MPAAQPNLLIQPMSISRLHKAPAFLKLFGYKAQVTGDLNAPTEEHSKFRYFAHRRTSFPLLSRVEFGHGRGTDIRPRGQLNRLRGGRIRISGRVMSVTRNPGGR